MNMMRVSEYYFDQEMPSEYFGQSSAQQLIKDPKLYTMPIVVSQTQPTKPPTDKPNVKPIAMRVDICCQTCVEVIRPDIMKLKGVKDVECDVFKHKVTVTGTATLADVLTAARKHFKATEWD